MSGTKPNPEGLSNPPIDEMLEKTGSKYALAAFSAARAKQINSYFTQLQEGLLESVGPMISKEEMEDDKSLSIAMKEINKGIVDLVPGK
ncbi:MAG: DNA-directed RNA polymerase subunit omega [Bifidobacteriaceae bacterium]|jgi:DNA-directed RNA polymerase subunit omega|nr:DNA-directed RNA polymerase subunit omega [Bifidobacteriaceae bacterium]